MQKADFFLRPYRPGDAPALGRLFCETIHAVNIRDYSQEQVDAWATGKIDEARWEREMLARCTVIAERAGEIIGFWDIKPDGYLDRLYVHKNHQREGVASALCDTLEQSVRAYCITTHLQ